MHQVPCFNRNFLRTSYNNCTNQSNYRIIIEISSNGRKYWLQVAISLRRAVRLRHRTLNDANVGGNISLTPASLENSPAPILDPLTFRAIAPSYNHIKKMKYKFIFASQNFCCYPVLFSFFLCGGRLFEKLNYKPLTGQLKNSLFSPSLYTSKTQLLFYFLISFSCLESTVCIMFQWMHMFSGDSILSLGKCKRVSSWHTLITFLIWNLWLKQYYVCSI